MRSLSSSSLLALWFLAACTEAPPSGPDPCAADPLGCREDTEFEVDPNCTNPDALKVELGENSGDFQPLTDPSAPTVHYGLQGGQHVELGVRFLNPDPSHRNFHIVFTIEPGAAPEEETTRELVVMEDELAAGPDGSLEILGLVLFVSALVPQNGGTIRLDAQDSCGRTAHVEHAFAAQ